MYNYRFSFAIPQGVSHTALANAATRCNHGIYVEHLSLGSSFCLVGRAAIGLERSRPSISLTGGYDQDNVLPFMLLAQLDA